MAIVSFGGSPTISIGFFALASPSVDLSIDFVRDFGAFSWSPSWIVRWFWSVLVQVGRLTDFEVAAGL